MPEKLRKTFAAEEDLLLQANEEVCYRQLLKFPSFRQSLANESCIICARIQSPALTQELAYRGLPFSRARPKAQASL